MSGRAVEIVSQRLAAERGALIAAAGALALLGATAAWRPELLAKLLGPAPAPQLVALLSFFATLPVGAEVGRRALRLRGSAEWRRLRLIGWTLLAYVASVTFGTAALFVALEGPAALAQPFALAARGLAVALLLLPWAAVPVAATAIALERWIRPTTERRLGPGGGPGPGTRRPLPRGRRSEPRPGRSAA